MRSQQGGVALLVVLWVMGALATLLTVIAASVHIQHRQASYLSQYTKAMFAAEAGLNVAVVNLLTSDIRARWRADGQPHFIEFDGVACELRVSSERGKLDLNSAHQVDVQRLLIAGGAAAQNAQQIAVALEARRQRQPLRILDEFRELPGMSFSLYRGVLPLITVWSGESRPDAGLAPTALARALGMAVTTALTVSGGQIVTVSSVAQLPNGTRASLQVTLMLISNREGARPYKVLRWQE